MSFASLNELLYRAQERGYPISEAVLQEEAESAAAPVREIKERMAGMLHVMKEAAHRGLSPSMRSMSGLTGGNAAKLQTYIASGNPLTGTLGAKASMYALACSEVNASMGVIVAAPTAGASGILPGVLLAIQEERRLPDDDLIRALFTASGVGAVIATRATLSGAEGGCQAECGSAAAMAAAAACDLCGASSDVCVQAAALALKNCLGLACDPVCGLVEVPCVKRNGIYAGLALSAADMALAGIRSVIPADEVIDAMYAIGSSMPASLRETAGGGLAATPTGLHLSRTLPLREY